MNARSIALVITFAAVAIALNAVKIPTIYWPGNFYQVSEIPVVVAFLLFGVKIGVLVGVFRLAGQLALFPLGPAYIVAYPMGFVAILLMLSGVYLASKFIARKSAKFVSGKKTAVYLTAFAAATRGGLMPFIDYGVFYRLLLPLFLGITISDAYIVGLVPFFILFNMTVPLYTVPIACALAAKMGKYLKIEPCFLKQS